MYQEILDTNDMMLLFLFYLSRPQLRLDENESRYFLSKKTEKPKI